jgi:hypothetical protein
MSLAITLVDALILMLIGAIPNWPQSKNLGYWPTIGLGLVMIVIVALLLLGWV